MSYSVVFLNSDRNNDIWEHFYHAQIGTVKFGQALAKGDSLIFINYTKT